MKKIILVRMKRLHRCSEKNEKNISVRVKILSVRVKIEKNMLVRVKKLKMIEPLIFVFCEYFFQFFFHLFQCFFGSLFFCASSQLVELLVGSIGTL